MNIFWLAVDPGRYIRNNPDAKEREMEVFYLIYLNPKGGVDKTGGALDPDMTGAKNPFAIKWLRPCEILWALVFLSVKHQQTKLLHRIIGWQSDVT